MKECATEEAKYTYYFKYIYNISIHTYQYWGVYEMRARLHVISCIFWHIFRNKRGYSFFINVVQRGGPKHVEKRWCCTIFALFFIAIIPWVVLHHVRGCMSCVMHLVRTSYCWPDSRNIYLPLHRMLLFWWLMIKRWMRLVLPVQTTSTTYANLFIKVSQWPKAKKSNVKAPIIKAIY